MMEIKESQEAREKYTVTAKYDITIVTPWSLAANDYNRIKQAVNTITSIVQPLIEDENERILRNTSKDES